MSGLLLTSKRLVAPLDRALVVPNEVSKGILSCHSFDGYGNLVNRMTGAYLDKTTLYSSSIIPVITPYGVGKGEPSNGGGREVYSGANNYRPFNVSCTFVINTVSTVVTNKVIAASTGGSDILNVGTASWAMLYSSNGTIGTVSFFLAWGTSTTCSFTGVTPGVHTVVAALANTSSNVINLYLDGELVSTVVRGTSYYYGASVYTSAFESPTLYSSGAGTVLMVCFSQGGADGDPRNDFQAQAISADPYCIFKPRRTFVPLTAPGIIIPTLTAGTVFNTGSNTTRPRVTMTY